MPRREVFKAAPLNLFIKFGTVIGVSGFFYLAYDTMVAFSLGHRAEAYSFLAATVPIGVLVFLSAGFAPRRYIVGAEELVVRSLLWSFSIPYQEVLSVEVKEKVIPRFYVGIGGLFSLCGMVYAESREGKEWVRMHATNWKRMVRIKTRSGDPYYLSPADPEKFVAAIKEHLGEKER